MTSDANAIVGNASGIGLKAYKKAQIGSILVKEKGGHLHYYNLPSSINNNDNLPSTSTTISNASPSSNSSNQTFDVQDTFWDDEDVLRQLLQDEESHTKQQQKDENDNS